MNIEQPAPICPRCGKPMRPARKIPNGGALPELHIYDYKECGVAVTEAEKPDRAYAGSRIT
jgi:hypothetical protein